MNTHYETTQLANLLVHEDVDDGVEHGAALGQDRRDHSSHRRDEARLAKGCHHGHHTVRHPAEQVTSHRGDHHEQDVELSAPRPRPTNPADLQYNIRV